MAQKKKDRWVSVEVKNASGRKVKKWKDTTTGKTYFSRPLRDPTKTSATGQFGVNKLTNDSKLNKSIKETQKKGWEASRKSNKKSASEGFTGGVLGGNIPGSKRSKIGSKSTTSTKTKTGSARNTTEAKNRKIHGDKKIDALKIKHSEWKKARKAGTLDAWEKKWHPNRKRKYGKLKHRGTYR